MKKLDKPYQGSGLPHRPFMRSRTDMGYTSWDANFSTAPRRSVMLGKHEAPEIKQPISDLGVCVGCVIIALLVGLAIGAGWISGPY